MFEASMQLVWVGHGGGRSEGSSADMVMLNKPNS